VFLLPGKGKVVIGKFMGTGGFQTLRLPANAEVTLQNLTISFWGDVPKDALVIDIVVADGLIIGGESPEIWFGRDPLCDALANVNAGQPQIVHSRHTTDHREVNVTLVGQERISLRVPCGSEPPQK
jgi:hypothetical protein